MTSIWRMNTLAAKRAIGRSVDEDGIAALVKRAKMLTRDQLIEQTVLAQGGDEDAMRAVIDGCSKLVLSVTRRVWMQWCSHLPDSAQFDDVFQAGLEGLFVAVQKFDASRGNTLTTMATPWIHTRAQRTIFGMLGVCHIPEAKIANGSVDRSLLAVTSMSIESSLVESGEALVHRLMGSDDDPACEAEDIMEVLAQVDERLPMMIQLVADGYTDGEVGEMYGVSYERIRQMRGKAARALTEAGLV
jgi:RNA polymerase sigma factor (sigma-70 family)